MKPSASDDPEGFYFFDLCLFLSLTDCSRINSMGKQFSRSVASLPGIGKTDFGIMTQSENFYVKKLPVWFAPLAAETFLF